MVDIRQGHHAVAEDYVGIAAALRRRKSFFGGLAAVDSGIGGNQLQDTRVHRSADGGGPVVKQLRNGLELADELPSGDRAIFDGAFSSSPYELAQACMQDTNSFCYRVLMTTPVAMCNRALND